MALTERSAGPLAEEELVRNRCADVARAFPPTTTPREVLLAALYDHGLAWVHFPEGSGGLGVSPKFQKVVNEQFGRNGPAYVAARNVIGYGMGGPTIAMHGDPSQRERWLRPLFTCEEIWCQLFSEPGAGSDVAALSTRAERDGDEWVVNGQKVWTTLAHEARWGMLVARTDPRQPKHRGLTYFVVDMTAPGVEVRPLRQITGEAEFNEVYLTDVRIPDRQRLDAVGEGWRVVLTTLMNERVAIGGGVPVREGGAIGEALKVWRAAESHDAAARDRLMRLWVESEVLRLTNIRAGQLRSKGTPGPEGSVGKIAMADLNKRVMDFTVDLLGAEGMLYGSYEMVRPVEANMFSYPQKSFLRVRANSIEGGTSEVMKNILGERVLGLPGEPRIDKDVAWADVPRS